MTIVQYEECADLGSSTGYRSSEQRAIASYQRQVGHLRCEEIRLNEALSEARALLGVKDELVLYREVLCREADHRLLNCLQLVVSVLALQGRAAAKTDAGPVLAVAAHRVAMIACIHRRLHSFDNVKTIELKRYLEELCGDFGTLLASDERPEQLIAVEGAELAVPATTGIPLGFIVSELITNAAKHGSGDIAVKIGLDPEKGYALSVCSGGRVLPPGFDPAASQGLGMKIICSLIGRIDGELRFGPGDDGQGARFTVLFS